MSLLLEREHELDRLRARLDAAQAGEGGLVVVEGAPGLGKTAVVRAAAVEAKQRGFEVARARGAELEREWPFGIARQLFEPALRRCSTEERAELLEGAAGLAAPVVFPELASGAVTVDASFGTLHGLYWLCANLAMRGPLLLVVDDAQWADEGSLRFLGVLVRRLDELVVLVLIAQRPAPAEVLAELAGDSQTELLTLRPLSATGVQRLLGAWSPDGVAEQFAVACEAATGGNPFLLRRLAERLRDHAIAFTAANAARVTGAGVEAVRDAVGSTLARLSPGAVALAKAIAVLGDEVELSVAAQLAGVDEGAAGAAVEALVRAAVLEDARPLRFVHAIVRDAVATRLSAGVRGSLHARAAKLLASRHASPDAVAVHLVSTEPRGQSWVVERLMTAARQAVAHGAPETALVWLERALAEPPASPAIRTEVVLDLALAERWLGRREAVGHLRDAYALAPTPALRARTALELIWEGGSALDVSELVALLDQAISELDDDRELILELEAARLTVLYARAPQRPTNSWAAQLQRWATLEGETPAERLLLAQLAVAHTNAGGPAKRAAAFAERAAGGPGIEYNGRGALSLLYTVWVLIMTDHLDAADRMLQRELRVARQRGSLGAYQNVCTFRGAVALRRGLLAAAEADLRTGLEIVPPHAWRHRQVIAYLLDALVQTGDLSGAHALLSAGEWDADLPDNEPGSLLLASRSGLRFAQGDPRRALVDALEARRRRVRHGSVVDWDGWSRIALAYHRLDERKNARREAEAFLVAARRWNTPGVIGQALRTSGLIEGGDRGLALLHDAAEHLERSPARLEYAQALVDYGAALRRRGDRRAARDPLRRGLDIAAACGAQPLTERARQELTATGLRVRREAQTGIAALTPSERRIVEHAATGATNPQIAQALFITVKTVEMHLHNAYRKLDITSRHQLPQHLNTNEN